MWTFQEKRLMKQVYLQKIFYKRYFFFQDKEAFNFIGNKVIPELLTDLKADEELKLWVAGCATGEEAYSLAILIKEQLTGLYKDTIVKIFATDIDTEAIAHAGKGLYNNKIEKNVSPDRLDKFFLKEENHYKIKPDLRKMLIFAQHDVTKNPPYCNMHLISCRNLLIYMTPVLQQKVFSMLLFGIKRDGYLFLGSTENPMPIMRHLNVYNKEWKVYKNIQTKESSNWMDLQCTDGGRNRKAIGIYRHNCKRKREKYFSRDNVCGPASGHGLFGYLH